MMILNKKEESPIKPTPLEAGDRDKLLLLMYRVEPVIKLGF